MFLQMYPLGLLLIISPQSSELRHCSQEILFSIASCLSWVRFTQLPDQLQGYHFSSQQAAAGSSSKVWFPENKCSTLYALQFSPSFLKFSGDSWSLVYSANFYENTMLVPAHLKPPKNEWDSHTLTSSNSVTTVLTWIIFNFESTSMDSTGVVWSRWHFSAMLSMAILMQPSISLCQEMTNNIWFSTGCQWWHYNYSPQQPFLVLSCTLSSSGKDRH